MVAESHEAYDVHRAVGELEAEMVAAAEALEFERAAVLRDEVRELKRMLDGGAGEKGGGRRQAAKARGRRK